MIKDNYKFILSAEAYVCLFPKAIRLVFHLMILGGNNEFLSKVNRQNCLPPLSEFFAHPNGPKIDFNLFELSRMYCIRFYVKLCLEFDEK